MRRGSMLLSILLTIMIIVMLAYGSFLYFGKDEEGTSIIETDLNALESAKDLKKMIENRPLQEAE